MTARILFCLFFRAVLQALLQGKVYFMDLASARKAADERRLYYILGTIGIVYATVVIYLALSTFGWKLLYVPVTAIFTFQFIVPTVRHGIHVLLDFFGVYFYLVFSIFFLFFLQRIKENFSQSA